MTVIHLFSHVFQAIFATFALLPVSGYLKLNKAPRIFNGRILNEAFNKVRYKKTLKLTIFLF